MKRLRDNVIVVVLVVIVVALVLLVRHQHHSANQARQDVATSDAVSEAARNAIDTLQNRSSAEDAIDTATAIAVKEIRNATNPAVVHSAVRDALCVRAEYADDAACQMRGAGP